MKQATIVITSANDYGKITFLYWRQPHRNTPLGYDYNGTLQNEQCLIFQRTGLRYPQEIFGFKDADDNEIFSILSSACSWKKITEKLLGVSIF